jgi:hypothetical protein
MLRTFAEQPAVRRSLPALGGAGALLLAGAAWWAMQSPNQTPLYAGLADGDKAAVADALQAAGIPYSIDRDTGNIDVGEDDVHKARMMLAGQGLPKAAPGGDTVLSSLPMGASRALEGETLRGAREADRGLLPFEHHLDDVIGVAALIGGRKVACLGLLGIDAANGVGECLAEAGGRSFRPAGYFVTGCALQRRILTNDGRPHLQQPSRIDRSHGAPLSFAS